MSACPFCAEEIRGDEAACPHCGSALAPTARPRKAEAAPLRPVTHDPIFYLVVAVLVVGGGVTAWMLTGGLNLFRDPFPMETSQLRVTIEQEKAEAARLAADAESARAAVLKRKQEAQEALDRANAEKAPIHIDGIPDLAVPVLNAEQARLGTEYQQAGIKEYSAGNYQGAADQLILSLKENPANADIRYYLAKALSMQGDADRALLVLKQMKRSGGDAFLAKVAESKSDPAFEKLRTDPRYTEVAP